MIEQQIESPMPMPPGVGRTRRTDGQDPLRLASPGPESTARSRICSFGRSYAALVRYRSSHYQAASWDRPRQVIAKVEHHLGELFPRVGFIVTTLTGTN